MDTNKYWKTKAGEYILITDLTDQHLTNIIKLIERNSENYKLTYLTNMYNFLDSLSGEQAAIDTGRAIDLLESDNEFFDMEDFLGQTINGYKAVKKEADRRKLKIN